MSPVPGRGCPTCGQVVHDRRAAVCPHCQDWLPSDKLPDAIPVPKRRPFPWAVAVCASGGLLLAVIVFACMLWGPRPKPAAPVPIPVAPVAATPSVPPVVPAPVIQQFASKTFSIYADSHIGEVVEVAGWAKASKRDGISTLPAFVSFVAFDTRIISCTVAPGKEAALAPWPNHDVECWAIVRGRCQGTDSNNIAYLDNVEVLSASGPFGKYTQAGGFVPAKRD